MNLMEVKKINSEKLLNISSHVRPDSFESFIWQEHIKWVVKTAIDSSKKREAHMWHMLFSGPSWFWKTTMAHIISKQSNTGIKAVTWYAINKPSDIISILNILEKWDILFIDEIHRLKPNIEEVLYIAMEDFVIDMVMPEWWNVRVPINPFTLIGATTKSESLSQPIKNRFVYHFHFMEYTPNEKMVIIKKYLNKYDIEVDQNILEQVSQKVAAVPREIHNMCIKIRDFVITQSKDKKLTQQLRDNFLTHSKIEEGGMTALHAKYLEILEQADRPMGVKAISVQLGINEKAVEEDVEPLLLKLWKIEKSAAGRILV